MTTEQLLSLLAGGVSAAVVTAGFNVWWDRRKQKIVAQWERRKYDTNTKLHIVYHLTETFYNTESELHFVTLEVGGYHEALRALEQQIAQNLQAQNPAMPAVQLQALHNLTLAPVRQWIGQMEANRWSQYNNSVKALRARAEAALSLTEYSLRTQGVYARLATLFRQFQENLSPPGVQSAQARLQDLRNREQEFKDILRQIREEAWMGLDS
ncbi:MAG: hypothetical protein EPN47_14570 [Acidobacteria bacterium]|nr:MAG: hypothetical protein EPN47_14570 [Acidobacteriota bacterium]